MENSMVNIKLVTMKDPCTACVIIDGLIRETLEKLKKDMDNINIEILELQHINEAHTVEGLEVEKFPAILINGEQVTAGSLPSKKQLIELIQA